MVRLTTMRLSLRMLATTRPSQCTVTALDVKLDPVTAIPVWPRRLMLGVILTPASGFSNTRRG